MSYHFKGFCEACAEYVEFFSSKTTELCASCEYMQEVRKGEYRTPMPERPHEFWGQFPETPGGLFKFSRHKGKIVQQRLDSKAIDVWGRTYVIRVMKDRTLSVSAEGLGEWRE
jgi:hypothetical protein